MNLPDWFIPIRGCKCVLCNVARSRWNPLRVKKGRGQRRNRRNRS